VTGTVVAVGTQAYIIADNTGAMMVYHYNNGRTVGENITISGEVTIYQKADGTSWGTPQFAKEATVVVNSTDNTWTYNPSVLDAAGVDAMLTETLSKEIEFAGKLVVSGNYINIEIAGATVQGSVKYVDNNAYADLNGKDVTVKGYFVGVSSKKYVNVLPYSIEAKESVNPEPEPSATIIDAVANVKAGKYYMAGYAEQYNNSSNGTVTTFAPYSYHMWTGGISTGSNFDLLTVNYSYENEKFTLNPNLSEQDAAKGTAQLVELVAVDGKTNAYYIKMGDKYLSCPAKRKAALVDTPTEWAFTDHAKGGICLTDVANNVILGTAGATYNMLRCYVAPATSLLYGVAFISADAAFDSTTPTPDPDPEPEPSVKALPYTESFKTSQGDFTINDVELGSLSYVWKHSTYNDSGYMKASAFKTAAVASESWLISPAISLSDATSPVVTFSHAHKFAGTPSNELTLWVSANDGAWEQLTIPTYSSNADWTFVESGEISLAKYVGSTIKVAFKYVSSTSAAATWEVKDFSVAEGSGSVTPDPEPEPEPSATIIDAVANVKAGKYYMAGYAEQYNNSSNGTVTTFAPYSYHMWTGGISTGSNFDLLTVNYSYENEKFTLNPDLSEQDAAKGTAQLVELVAVDGKTNAYYIKMGDKYLSCPAKRKAALVDTPTEWAFTDHAKGGICLTDVANNVILGTAGATYNLLRCYVAPATSLLYGVAFISADAAFDSTTPTPDPEPEPEPDPTPGDTVAINTITTAGTYAVTGTVVAVGTQAYIIADNTGAMMVYHYNNGRTVGENITIS
ncbi:MAG: choice-of-anchor J domain-containing protein, partial [Alistipes sp.]|nr:choice-of-anchor J domain-containing protein [Alistipes sp.]